MSGSDGERPPGEPGRGTAPDGGREPMDQVLLALSEPRRRYLLYFLEQRGDAYIDDAARFIAACEADCDTADVPTDSTETVRRDLYHVHLPKLADENIIDYDRRSGAMCYQDPPPELSAFVDLASTMELSEREIEKF